MLKILLIINIALLVSGKPGNPWYPFPDPGHLPDPDNLPHPDQFPDPDPDNFPHTDDDKDDHHGGGLSIGGVIAGIVTFAVILVLIWYLCKLGNCIHLRVESICDICN